MFPKHYDITTEGGDYYEICNRGIYVEGDVYLTPTNIQLLWDTLVEKATPANKIITFEELDPNNGLPILPNSDPDWTQFKNKELPNIIIKKGTPYQLSLNLQAGYLLLLSRGTSGKIYSFYPSLVYGTQQRVSSRMYIPQDNSLATQNGVYLTYMDEGKEELLAILTKQSLNLSWFSPKLSEVIHQLTRKSFIELFKNLEESLILPEIFHLTFDVY
ncbi:hypothetical protein Lepto7375DRAFT_0737 [Leptolyngbya sp. PCC 7375]|nr:hypothetical protein Lepto7375DRAFT_0737 [Leptolyngbya sp. PCC 7375]